MNEVTTDSWITQHQQHFEQQLARYLPAEDSQLHHAMRYSSLNGGKRLRPLLIYATGLGFAAPLARCDRSAVAIELIHCYSLVHDDLPAMDDDDLRRGNPSCHKAFDEATAILVGDALQSLAFEILSRPLDQPHQLELIHTLATATGSLGMAGGQALDMQATDQLTELTQLQTIHTLKTGALFSAAIRMGALSAGYNDPHLLTELDRFAHHLGLAFQIRDDILDVEASTEQLGKSSGKDADQSKATYPALLGLETAKQQLHVHLQQAEHVLSHLEQLDPSYLLSLLNLITLPQTT